MYTPRSNAELSLEDIRTALTFISAQDREQWVETGMAIKSHLGEAGHEIWDEWSRSVDSYETKSAKVHGSRLVRVVVSALGH